MNENSKPPPFRMIIDFIVEQLNVDVDDHSGDPETDMQRFRALAITAMDEMGMHTFDFRQRNYHLDMVHEELYFNECIEAEYADREWFGSHRHRRFRVRAPHLHENFTAFKPHQAYQSFAVVSEEVEGPEHGKTTYYPVRILIVHKGHPLNMWDDVAISWAFDDTPSGALC